MPESKIKITQKELDDIYDIEETKQQISTNVTEEKKSEWDIAVEEGDKALEEQFDSE